MQYLQLIYRSQATPGLGDVEVLEILRQSQNKNLPRRISGLLVFQDGQFVQLLEGTALEVEDLFATIAADSRHTGVEVLARHLTDQVAMPTWAMAYFSPTLSEQERANNPAVLSLEDAQMICSVLPEHLGTAFLALLKRQPA